jgi:hypothetical protein
VHYVGAVLLVPVAAAITLTSEGVTTVADGVTVEAYRTSSPATNLWVARIDLCTSGIYVDASRASDSTRSTGAWADSMDDVVLATNGDFFKTDPLRVYGDAVGGGVRWPLEQTGLDPDYSGEWYYEHHGWIAFLHDGVTWTHTGWVKSNAASFEALGGWAPDELLPDPPEGTLALVSGFPELVVEGVAMTCSDPEASDCFPDRSDMRDRNPRTAMGITEDLGTFLLVVADGRTSDASGLYGSELASVMEQLGAWEAFNLDGGGSSQLYVDGDYINDYDGNNSGSGLRSVADHWGVFAGASYLPDRPGHCASAAACETLPAAGGTLDDTGSCFRGFGDQAYWRVVDGSGEGGSLRWTNAFESDSPDNWAWWRIELAYAGSYTVEVSSDATYSVHDSVRYQVHAAGVTTEVRVDPTGGGWHSLGSFDFDAGGDQWVAVFDDEDSVDSDQHIVADAVRLTRVGDPVDTGGDTPPGDTGEPGDSASPGSADGPGALVPMPSGCGCDNGGPSASWFLLLALRRRRGG